MPKNEKSKEIPKYRATRTFTRDGKKYRVNRLKPQTFEFEGPPPLHLEPLNKAAEKALADKIAEKAAPKKEKK